MNALSHQKTSPQHWGTRHPPALQWGSPVAGGVPMHQVDWVDAGPSSVLACRRELQNATPECIRDEYAPKLRQLQQAAQLAKANGQAAMSISLMFDLVSEEAWMVRAMAASVGKSLADFDDQRFIRRSDIDALMACAQEVGDCDAKLLAEVLLQNQQRHMAGVIAGRDGQDGLFARA